MIAQWSSPTKPSGTCHSCQIHEEVNLVDLHLGTRRNPRTKFYSCRTSSRATSGSDEPKVALDQAHESSLGDAMRPPRRAGRTATSGHLHDVLCLLRASQQPHRPPWSHYSRSQQLAPPHTGEQPQHGARQPHHAHVMMEIACAIPSTRGD
jgi:hypothetical protein